MYKTFKEARAAALDVVERLYGGDKMGCVVAEDGINGGFGFRFYEKDSGGEFVRLEHGELYRFTRI